MKSNKEIPGKHNLPLELVSAFSSQDDRDAYAKSWRNSTYVTDPIRALILHRLEQLNVDRIDDYSVPNWAMLRADKNGQIRAYEHILKLLP